MQPSTVSFIAILFLLHTTSTEQTVHRFNLPPQKFQAYSHKIVKFVNRLSNGTWRAAVSNRFHDESSVRKQLGALKHPLWMLTADKELDLKFDPNSIPSTFDARERWPDCPTIREIRDQGACGSCWIFGAVEAMSDRICIHSKGKIKVHLSAKNLLSCCKDCGFGCDGGFLVTAWSFWTTDGVVTGGQYGSKQGCQPYTIPKCGHFGHSVSPPCGSNSKTPTCEHSCRSGYDIPYYADKHKGKTFYYITSRNVKKIQAEVMINGPVESTMNVYSDFVTYKSGIYQHVTGKYLGGHAIKILGWGEEKGTPYWLVANSWNTDWGDKGFFKILRGKNECDIEDNAFGGLPNL